MGAIRSEERRPIHGPALAFVVLLGAVTTAAALVGPDVDLEAYPVAEVSELQDRGLVGAGVRLVTHDFVGNYLTARLGEDAQVFVDDRFDMYPQAVLDDYVALQELSGPEIVLDRWETDAVVWRAREPLATWLEVSDDWHVLSADDDYVVYCRRSDPRCRY